MILALGRVELTLLLRNKSAAALALVVPLLTGVFFAMSDWGLPVVVTLQLVMTLGFTVYVTATTSLVARRQDLYLKRLRTGEASDTTVLVGLLTPTVLLGCAQTLVLLTVNTVAGAPLPERPLLLVLAVLGGAVMCCAIGVATSGITSTAELAQITTAPFFFVVMGGAFWALSAETVDFRMLVVPGGQIAELVKAAWGGPTDHVAIAAAALIAWTAGGYALATRYFRWEPRS
jgi:ABC-2 type transport system permease protein